MDEEGYVPVAFVLTYPNVSIVGAPYPEIINRLHETSMLNSKIEIDLVNDTIRLKEQWEMVNLFISLI
jgi:hypothetical protein